MAELDYSNNTAEVTVEISGDDVQWSTSKTFKAKSQTTPLAMETQRMVVWPEMVNQRWVMNPPKMVRAAPPILKKPMAVRVEKPPAVATKPNQPQTTTARADEKKQ